MDPPLELSDESEPNLEPVGDQVICPPLSTPKPVLTIGEVLKLLPKKKEGKE